VEKCPSLTSCGAFLTTATVMSFPLSKVAEWVPPLLPSLACLFIYSLHEILPLPHSLELRAPCSLCYMSFFLFFPALCILLSLFFFSIFFPWVGSLCPGGYVDLAQGCLWEYCMLLSSPGGLLLPSRIGAGIWQHRSPPGLSI
jgi:hypothetical protein